MLIIISVSSRECYLFQELKNLFRAREILYMLTWRDITIRYKQSIMGLMWAILMPTLIVIAGVLVRVAAAKYTSTAITVNDLASIMVRATAWSFFISTIRFGTNSLIGNNNLVTKLAFPKEVFPLASAIASLVDFLVAIAVVAIILLFAGWRPSFEVFWILPIIAILFLLSAGLAMLLSAANLFYRDVKYIVEIFLTYAIFFTPVLYEVSASGQWANYLLANPVSPLLEAFSDTAVRGCSPNYFWLTYSAIVAVFVSIIGYWLFKRLEANFAENI